jgi:hypothetical protein
MVQTMREFLENGSLAPVAFGLSPDEVRRAVGGPPEVGGTPKQRIWKYGPLEIGFRRDPALRTEAVSFIGLYFRQERLDLPAGIRTEGWFPSRRTTKEEVVRFLDGQQIGYRQDEQLTSEMQSALATECGARIIFDCSEGEATLDSIQLLRELRPSERRQTSQPG